MPDPADPSSELQQLVIVRLLATEAERQLARDDDFGHGLAVSLSQDAIELLIRVVVRTHSLNPKGDRPTLSQMMDAVDAHAEGDKRVPHRQRVDDLNKARVAFKHTGLCPSRADAERLVRYGIEFLEVAIPRFFGIPSRRVYLSYGVRSEKVRTALVKAEEALLAENYLDAVIEASVGFAEANGPLRALLPELQPMPSLREGMGQQVKILTEYAAGLRLVALAGLLSFDIGGLLRFKRLVPVVLHSMSGKRQVLDTRLGQYTADEAEFAVRFATEFALAVQRKLG